MTLNVRNTTTGRPTIGTMNNPAQGLDEEEAVALGRRFIDFLEQLRIALPAPPSGLGPQLTGHLGFDAVEGRTVARQFDPSEHVNLQLGLNALLIDRGGTVIGLDRQVMHFGGFSLPGLATGAFHGPTHAAPVEYLSLPSGPGEEFDCIRVGLVLGHHEGEPLAVLMAQGDQHGPERGLRVEVMARSEAVTARFLDRLVAVMKEVNIYRGKTVSFSFGEYGDFGLNFVDVPQLARDDVILPEETLDAIEEHAIGVSTHAEELLAGDQHVKRGLLLYGPPGTGKTHTVMYLAGCLQNRTTIILAGPAVNAIGQAGALARSLAPATIVIEDVDLIATDRDAYGHEANPMLFQLLNEMDGMAADADVLFVLTTNRVDALEEALTARPGRIDQALEIGLPDAENRGRLLDLYLGRRLDDESRARVVERTDGAAAAFIKELARRATLRVIRSGGSTEAEIDTALDGMLSQSSPVLRASLGLER